MTLKEKILVEKVIKLSIIIGGVLVFALQTAPAKVIDPVIALWLSKVGGAITSALLGIQMKFFNTNP